MSVNFNELLSKPIEQDKKPPVKPPGTYTGNIQGYKFDVSKQQKTPFCRFTFNNIQPGEALMADDQKALQDEDGNSIDFSKWQPWVDFYLTDASRFRLREFLESLGLDISGRSYDSVLPETKGMSVLLEMTQSSSEDGKNIYTNVKSVQANI